MASNEKLFQVDAKGFQKALLGLAAHEKVSSVRLLKQLAAQAFAKIKQLTPVKTGNAERGWRYEEENGGLTHVIYNAVAYIIGLEYGRSTRAPNGMVRITMAEIRQAVKGKYRSIFPRRI